MKYPLMIKGAVSTGNFQEVYNPTDRTVIGEVEIADEKVVELALRNATESYKKVMRHMPAYRRAEILYKVSSLMKEQHEELSQLIAKEGGKPLKDARVEVTRAINTIKMSGDEALNLNGEQLTMDRSKGTENHLAFTIREPIGPVLAISAFNHPVNLICHQVGTAFAAGNTVIVKPAEATPLSAIKMIQLFKEAGVPEGAINFLMLPGRETGRLLVPDKRIKFVNFIGSAKVGWSLQKNTQPGVRLALEHGGAAPAVVAQDADLGLAIPSIVKGGFYHAGQVCVSTQIVYAHEDVYDVVVEKLKSAVSALKTGAAIDAETDVGPLIRPGEVDRVESWVNDAVKKGAKVELGGKRISETFYEPTILTNVSADMKVVTHEIFGPVICVQKYSDLQKVIEDINETDFAFQSAIYTQDIDRGMYFSKEVEMKATMINQTTAFRVDWMPFGGYKTSGLGVGGMRYSIEDMTEEKLVVINLRGLQ